MSDIEKVVTRTRKIEKLLRVQYHADGKGLHQLITSSEERLPHDVIGKLRYIATIRNKIVHEDNYKLDDRKQFLSVCDECERELTPRSSRFIWRVVVLLMGLITFAALGVYYLHWDELMNHLS
ncbi:MULTISPECIES: hypothetical protein [Vibrio]|uniref:DUF4145 domain-containing protein n=2 Tax=Vibrio TaxID=662 RepID=A0A1E5CMK8_9VIBR|nr:MULTISPECIES: hypothetical protein [Vibrio]NOH85584.1 DUF4145 domain-containing protein [Vibrio sp. 03-59-1]OEE70839.1 DUF4145 domain-containing protein [Vibrio genomosp. F6 str. FF-238]RBW64473.1 DUF4145 domain-containing protein [Vibrionales bacterium C3R12]TKF18777.1 DUF4145 domain-containing protein [Vibrio genomosp. F6]